MSQKNVDYKTLRFGYHPTKYRYVSYYSNGTWDEGSLSQDATIQLNESACVFQYAQTVFEGMKAYRTVDNRVVIFRPDLNAKRMEDSAIRLQMPPFDKQRFLQAVIQTVQANIDAVPPYGSNASLYLRPFMIGTSPVLGVHPASEYEFRVFCCPVGPYFQAKARSLTLRICDYDRAAPHGTGHIKAGLNYAMSLYAIADAHEQGYDENIYLDSKTRTTIEETGGANILFVTKDHKIVTPKSNTILPSITRRSLEVVAKDYLGLEFEEKTIHISELQEFVEAGLCGTAAIISPVGQIDDQKTSYIFSDSKESYGPILQQLYNALTDIQMGRCEAPNGWLYEVPTGE